MPLFVIAIVIVSTLHFSHTLFECRLLLKLPWSGSNRPTCCIDETILATALSIWKSKCFSTIFSLILQYVSLVYLLTRFNKIAIQGTPQMAVDKETIICLSRDYSYYCKCNFPLLYMYPALTRYLSILFLNILTLLACTHSCDNLFHTLMVL